MKGKITTALIDLSGTLHIEDKAIPGAIEALKKLRSYVNVKFVTNTTKESAVLFQKRLSNCGFDINKNEMFTSLLAARQLIVQKNLRPYFIIDDNAMSEFDGIDTTDPNAVVIGLAPKKFNNENMNKAFKLIKENNAHLIAIHKGRYYEKEDGLNIGPGAYVAGLEFATGIKAEIVGKPDPLFFKTALKCCDEGAKEENAVMIGDDVNDDVIGAINCGMNAILVKTGKYRNGDEMKIEDEYRNVAESFVEAVNMIIDIV